MAYQPGTLLTTSPYQLYVSAMELRAPISIHIGDTFSRQLTHKELLDNSTWGSHFTSYPIIIGSLRDQPHNTEDNAALFAQLRTLCDELGFDQPTPYFPDMVHGWVHFRRGDERADIHLHIGISHLRNPNTGKLADPFEEHN